MAEIDILEGLNLEQKKAVAHSTGPLLIIAGAGTGKTTVITRRIAQLIKEEKATADEILALTFTEKAAGEMEERVESLLPIGYLDFWISTFHAFGQRILEDHALDIGLSNDFRLLTDTEQLLLLREHINDFELDYYRPKGNPTKFVSALVSHFSRLKDEDITPEQYVEFAEQLQQDTDSQFKKSKKTLTEEEKAKVDEAQRVLEVAHAYHQYQQLLRDQNAMDFGDLIVETIHLFNERPALLNKYRGQFKYILVDEFQDTNYAQYELIKMLAAPANNLTVVADDDQSIYHFRGASMSNILIFQKDFPDAESISLVENYRSQQNVLDLAYEFIRHNNPNRLEESLGIDKRLRSNVDGEAEVTHLHSQSLEGEAKMVVDTVIGLKKKNRSMAWNDVAILVRANDQAQTFIPYLERAGIPYQFLASKGLFAKPIILDVTSFLRLLDNYRESRAMHRVLTFDIWKIPHHDLVSIAEYSTKHTQSLYETCTEIRSVTGLAKETYAAVERLLTLVERLTKDARRKSAGEITLQFLEDSGYLQAVSQMETAEATEQFLYLNQFYKYIEAFERAHTEKTVHVFINELVALIEAGEEGRLKPDFDEGPESVKLMTVHSAKGLEFDYVFLVNLVDKRFPTIGRKEPIQIPDEIVKDVVPEGDWHLEEERRLFYVGMTRAKKGLYLTSGEDYGGARKKKPSRFLVESGFVDTKPEPTGEVVFNAAKAVTTKQAKEELKHLPDTFSFTQLKAYQTCPWQYRFSFILKVPVPGKPSFSFGKSMHGTLYEFFRRLHEQSMMEQDGLFGGKENNKKSPSLSEDDLLRIYEEKWIDEWYLSKNQRDEYYARGKEALQEFYKLHSSSWPQVKCLEQKFTVNIGEHKVKGAIDRVDQLDDGVEILDYKTGSFPKSGKRDIEQLYIYARALEDVFELKPAKLTYYYIEDNKAISEEYDPERMDKVVEWARTLVDKIRSGNFEPTPGFDCKHCDYREICEYRKH